MRSPAPTTARRHHNLIASGVNPALLSAPARGRPRHCRAQRAAASMVTTSLTDGGGGSKFGRAAKVHTPAQICAHFLNSALRYWATQRGGRPSLWLHAHMRRSRFLIGISKGGHPVLRYFAICGLTD
jgi:hypothetical protein